MAYKFNEEDKAVTEFKESIPFGVHKVKITGVIPDVTDAGKDFIEVGVITDDGLETSVRCWFTGGASNISFNTLRQIAVHNAKDEEGRDKRADAIDSVKDTDELGILLNDMLMGGECWISKFYDPTRTYQAKDGSTRKSVNTNIYGYEPKLKPNLMPRPTVDEVFPGNEQLKAEDFPADEVPFPSAGDGKKAEGIPNKW